MAVVEYACGSCGLVEEKLFRSEAPDEVTCSSCGEAAEKCLSDFGFVFGDGDTPGNTGVDSLDRDYDKRIGRDAETRWEYVKDRNSRKRRVQKKHGEDGKVPLRLNSQGEYEPMPEKDVKRFQHLHKLGSEALKGDDESSESSE